MRWLFCVWILASSSGFAEVLADAAKGEKLLESQRCLECHHFDRYARSGTLSKLLKKRLSAARLVGAMWNHAPTMWKTMQREGVPVTQLSSREANDLLAWFAAAGYFEPPGDARKGAKLFVSENCSSCHSENGPSQGPPVSQWKSISNPVDLFYELWAHGPLMKIAMDQRKMPWPSLSAEEMRDILTYANAAGNRANSKPTLQIGDDTRGKAIFQLKECQNCHEGHISPETVPREHTLTELAAILWNHAPMMLNLPPSLNRDEISALVASLWKSQYFEPIGRATQGKEVFEAKKCNVCHQTLSASQRYDAGVMLAAVWKHTPAVMAQAQERKISWPTFLDKQMEDLIAYANQARGSSLVK